MKYKEFFDFNPEIPVSDIERVNKYSVEPEGLSDEGSIEYLQKFLLNKLQTINGKDCKYLKLMFSDYSIKDISYEIGDSLSAVKTRIFRIRQKAKPLLEEWKSGITNK